MKKKTGKPSPIKLNKDHALAILAPPPAGQELVYPHAMSAVCGNNLIQNRLLDDVTQSLGLKEEYTEFELVCEIWSNFFSMIQLLRKDPDPVLKDLNLKGSTNPCDYVFGYKQEEKSQYILHAESFYQLFQMILCLRADSLHDEAH